MAWQPPADKRERAKELLDALIEAALELHSMGAPAKLYLRAIASGLRKGARGTERGQARKRIGRGGISGGRHGKPGPEDLGRLLRALPGVKKTHIARLLSKIFGGTPENWRRNLNRARPPANGSLSNLLLALLDHDGDRRRSGTLARPETGEQSHIEKSGGAL